MTFKSENKPNHQLQRTAKNLPPLNSVLGRNGKCLNAEKNKMKPTVYMESTASFMFRFTLSNDSQFLLNPNGISSHSPGLRQRRYPGNDFRAWISNPKGVASFLLTQPLWGKYNVFTITQGSGICRNPGLNYAAPLGHNYFTLT